MRHRVFLLPPYEWAGASFSSFTAEHSKQIMHLLQKENHPIISSSAEILRKAVVYTIVHVNGNHWCALEVDVAMKRVLVFDPARKGGEGIPCEVKRAERLLAFLKTLGEKKSVSALKPTWKYQQALGGQQDLSVDQFNCAIISAEWVLYRIYNDV